MRREDLEHVVSAAAQITEEEELVVVGSQAILPSHPDAPDTLLLSIEADIYPLKHPEKADAIDAAIGDGSSFHRQFGYYAHGVGPETAKAPAGWEDRMLRIEIPPRPGSKWMATAYCLEEHDLVLAKCARGDMRDWQWVEEAIRGEVVQGSSGGVPSSVLTPLAHGILDAGLDDWVPLLANDGLARKSYAGSDVTQAAMGAVREILTAGLAEIGDVSDGGFSAWDEPLDEALARVEALWETTDQGHGGFVLWVSNTAAGDALARKLARGID
jgi:Nucleotidyltransferase of unknown function (DUF6036)